jgi:hypothetical protein
MFEERKDGMKIGETCDITLGYADVTIYPNYEASRGYQKNTRGRIVFHKYGTTAVIKLAKGAKITAIVPSLSAGSENTKRLNIGVGYLFVDTPKYGKLEWTVMDSVLSSEFTLQSSADGEKYELPEIRVGGSFGLDCRILNVKDLRKAQVQNA